MPRQRAVREAERCAVVIQRVVKDAASIQRPETEMPDEHRDNRARLDRCGFRKELDPLQVEMAPLAQRTSGALEVRLTVANEGSLHVNRKTPARILCEPNRTV